MRFLKIFEDFKRSKVSLEDLIQCIESDGNIYTEIVKGYPNNDPTKPIKPVSVDDNGIITVDIDGVYYEVELDKVKKIDYK